MVVLNKIYTKTGDDGTTALGSGERRKKYDLRVAAYGTVDEANACIGLARLHLVDNGELDAVLMRIQNDLFDLGADLATPEIGETPDYEPLRITSGQVTAIEEEIDRMNKELKPLRSFVLPGGSPAAAYLHLARTVARRAERMIVELSEEKGEQVGGEVICYMNRLSDFLFVAARASNENGAADVLWVPGANR
ncbi:cob(I)yrinic acid a,c-diamide adenosyltransferase [Salaquimonas pukyongi]|uniref:cob(I)yrinic acid a,c-diamide adenosyltransferase n=1 Tax=Salaquimonas pukyongi TaxID=2712698 RepID=UPI00096BB215|nr:cob(I)yrinic acid a,c-diamide adenosyltransferase [Salaquimonas pukyongi]